MASVTPVAVPEAMKLENKKWNCWKTIFIQDFSLWAKNLQWQTNDLILSSKEINENTREICTY